MEWASLSDSVALEDERLPAAARNSLEVSPEPKEK